ncbi:hypothetical protein G7Z17_g4504 [Cylindrodendrum hubeiense]|uniref:Cupin type-2 domain-containing protein n=1 Tax=Cylindrodendrum hubeiense TaxID=595255 RepID=A0A9P5H8P0_9HYPO|nr:hypothetical protein G7Z17_g4504 [Cylindrodendrum hubeiense]
MGISSDTPLRRVVTTHKSSKSTILFDESIELQSGFGSNAVTLWQNFQHPAELRDSDPVEPDKRDIYASGSLIRVVDFPPNSQGHNHRTASLDYGIVLEGELELLMEDDSRTTVGAGDVIVQQAVGTHFFFLP